jgi:hypothetical protein
MKHDELKIGMKVRIKSKSVWEEDIEQYLSNDYGVGKFYKENGYAFVTKIGEESEIEDCDYELNRIIIVGDEEDLEYEDGDFFIAEDLEPYVESITTHVTMAESAFYQFKTLTQALEQDQIAEDFGHLSDATSNYIIEKLGLERIDFVTSTVDLALIEKCTFDELLDRLGVDFE